jgi:hypothetical protein
MKWLCFALIATALAGAPLAVSGPAQAQMLQGPLAKKKAADKEKAAAKQKKTEEIDSAYQAATGGQSDQKPKAIDPWAKMR